jgi:hypothetical protein
MCRGLQNIKRMSDAVELTPAQQAEVARRKQIEGDLDQLMELRFAHRADWFRTHPDDIPPRP